MVVVVVVVVADIVSVPAGVNYDIVFSIRDKKKVYFLFHMQGGAWQLAVWSPSR